MNEKAKKSLFDILAAISDIEQFVAMVDGLEEYKQTPVIRRAVERMLSIIGEAATRFERDTEQEYPLQHNCQIRGLRNRIVHVYDDLDNETVWGVVVTHLPALKLEVEKILANER